MRYPRRLALFLAIVTLALLFPASAGTTRRASQPLGTGAQFLPSTALFYLGFDADPEQPQLQYLDRLSAVYLRAPEVDEASRQLGGLAGGMSLEELRQGVSSWAGGEVFAALPEAQDLRQYSPFGDVVDDGSSCREPGVLVGAAIGDVAAFRTFVTAINERIATRVAREHEGQRSTGQTVRRFTKAWAGRQAGTRVLVEGSGEKGAAGAHQRIPPIDANVECGPCRAFPHY